MNYYYHFGGHWVKENWKKWHAKKIINKKKIINSTTSKYCSVVLTWMAMLQNSCTISKDKINEQQLLPNWRGNSHPSFLELYSNVFFSGIILGYGCSKTKLLCVLLSWPFLSHRFKGPLTILQKFLLFILSRKTKTRIQKTHPIIDTFLLFLSHYNP